MRAWSMIRCVNFSGEQGPCRWCQTGASEGRNVGKPDTSHLAVKAHAYMPVIVGAGKAGQVHGHRWAYVYR